MTSIQDADLIIVLDDGKINGLGTQEELLKTIKSTKKSDESQEKGFGEHVE